MEEEREARLALFKSWSRFVMRELASVRYLIDMQSAPDQQRPSEADVRAAAEPHMPILLHKRSKAHDSSCGQLPDPQQWSAELKKWAGRWAYLAANDDERARLLDLLDHIVSAEQLRLDAQSAAMPMTSRFDTSWAI